MSFAVALLEALSPGPAFEAIVVVEFAVLASARLFGAGPVASPLAAAAAASSSAVLAPSLAGDIVEADAESVFVAGAEFAADAETGAAASAFRSFFSSILAICT